MKKMTLVMTALLALGGCCACGAGDLVVYDEAHTDIAAAAGERFAIAQRDNPSTGYVWSSSVSDKSVVALDQVAAVADVEGLPGSPATRTFTFTALKQGSARIDMVRQRAWDPRPDDRTIQYSVTVGR